MHAVKLFFPHPNETPKSLESVSDNVFWTGAVSRLSVVIPTYRYDASTLIDMLARCAQSSLVEFIVYDDGTRDHEMLARMQAAAGSARAAIRIVSYPMNRGPAAVRNAAAEHARAMWVLFLDADMSPDNMAFLEAYLDAEEKLEEPSVVVGGQSLRFASKEKAFALHRWASRGDCVSADERRKDPGRYITSSNIMVHRDVLKACPFDEGFVGWGWESDDWAQKVQSRFPVMHIDNAATHLGLETDKALMAKYAKAAKNFARFVKQHPDHAAALPLYKSVMRKKKGSFSKLFRAMAGGVAASRLFPTGLRGRALKSWQAHIYAEAL
ncbi:MAG TPA: glycosyltransferase [Hyphomonadaceae bacterium]|nr:glycosyltransferase [Hyphomonadaceae bacterium]